MSIPVDQAPVAPPRTFAAPRAVVLAGVAVTALGLALLTLLVSVPAQDDASTLLAGFGVLVEGSLVLTGCGALGVTVVLALQGHRDPAATARLRTAGSVWAGLWALSLLYGQPVLWVGEVRELLGPSGGALLAVLGAGALALLLARGPAEDSGWLALGLGLAAMNAHLVSVHAVHEGHHEGSVLSIAAISIHVAAVSLWFGGLLALALHTSPEARADGALLQRYSRLALLCYAAVTATGLLQVHDLVGLGALLTPEPYALVIDVKLALLVVIGGFGLLHRTVTLPRLVAGRPRLFWRVVAVEILLLAAAAGLAAGLGSIPAA